MIALAVASPMCRKGISSPAVTRLDTLCIVFVARSSNSAPPAFWTWTCGNGRAGIWSRHSSTLGSTTLHPKTGPSHGEVGPHTALESQRFLIEQCAGGGPVILCLELRNQRKIERSQQDLCGVQSTKASADAQIELLVVEGGRGRAHAAKDANRLHSPPHTQPGNAHFSSKLVILTQQILII